MRVLIVDDHPDTADALQMLLQSAGHEVHVAYDGSQALAVAAEHPPELAFIDIQLPDTSGYALAKLLRTKLGRRVNLIGITGGDTKRLPFAGTFDQHAIKPISAQHLYQLIDVARDASKNASQLVVFDVNMNINATVDVVIDADTALKQ